MALRRVTSLILVSAFLASAIGIGAWAAEERPPVVLVMPGGVGDGSVPTALEVVSAVGSHLSAIGKVEVVTFDLENPTIARYVLERKIEDDLSKIVDPKTSKEIADLLKADYILSVHGEVRPNLAIVALRMTKVSGKDEWTAGAESGIAQATGPQAARNVANAISTAASSAVSQIDLTAFSKFKPKPAVEVVDIPTEPNVTTAFVPVEEPPARNLAAEFTSHMNAADRYAQLKDLPNVIYELRQAVNIEPGTISVRLKLAEAYSALGRTDEAVDELRRALLFKPDDPAVYNTLGQFYLANGSLKEAGEMFSNAVRLDPANIDARVSLGNILWNQNKLDEAAAVFEEAAKLQPTNAAPHERLYKLYWARRNYALAVEHLVASKAAGGPVDEVSRYKIAAGVVHAQLTEVLGKLDETWEEYEAGQIAREDYYRDCKDISARIDDLSAFLSMQTAPSDLKRAHAHGVFGANLLAQSVGSLISYLETDKQQYADQAALSREEAKAELVEFGKAVSE